MSYLKFTSPVLKVYLTPTAPNTVAGIDVRCCDTAPNEQRRFVMREVELFRDRGRHRLVHRSAGRARTSEIVAAVA
jgi:hypothetical protein